MPPVPEVETAPRPRTADPLTALLRALGADQDAARRSIHLTPSENVLSPLARLPFVLDTYSRYFFDHLAKFGAWSFFGGLGSGRVEQDVLLPLLRELAGAPYVTVQPLSGLHCMTVAMSALSRPGDTVVTVPVEGGGHICTAGVAGRLGLGVRPLPMTGPYDIDPVGLAELLARDRPRLVYLDQSSQLFPFDPRPVRQLIDRHSPDTVLHVDASHVNGLILGGALANPLDRGADSFGGSTHKTLPGPHKGFLATRRPELAEQFDAACDTLVSHHQPAAVVSLAVTLLELRHCGGAEYARAVLANARLLAGTLAARGVDVAAADRGFTGCHQVWADPRTGDAAVELSTRLHEAGLAVNRVGVPGLSGPVLRLSVAETTRLGAGEAETVELADLLADAILTGAPAVELRPRVARLRQRLDRPRYCATVPDLAGTAPDAADGPPAAVLSLLAAISELVTAPREEAW